MHPEEELTMLKALAGQLTRRYVGRLAHVYLHMSVCVWGDSGQHWSGAQVRFVGRPHGLQQGKRPSKSGGEAAK